MPRFPETSPPVSFALWGGIRPVGTDVLAAVVTATTLLLATTVHGRAADNYEGTFVILYDPAASCPPEAAGSRDLLKHMLFGPASQSVQQELGLTGVNESDIQLMVAFNPPTAMACGIITNDNQSEINATWSDGKPVFDFTIFRVQNRYFAVHSRRDPLEITDGVARIRRTRSLISVYDGSYNRIKGYSL